MKALDTLGVPQPEPPIRVPDHMTVQDLASARSYGQRSTCQLFALIRRPFDQRKAKDMAPKQDFCLEQNFSRDKTFMIGCVEPRERVPQDLLPVMEHALARLLPPALCQKRSKL